MVLAFLEKWLHLCPPSRVAELRTFCIMLRTGIAQFVGSWVSESGYHLRIKKVRKGRASVDFLDPRGVERTPITFLILQHVAGARCNCLSHSSTSTALMFGRM